MIINIQCMFAGSEVLPESNCSPEPLEVENLLENLQYMVRDGLHLLKKGISTLTRNLLNQVETFGSSPLALPALNMN